MDKNSKPGKSLILLMGDFRNNIVGVVNNSGLSPYFTLPIVRELAGELEKLASAQYDEELAAVNKSLTNGGMDDVHSN